MTKRYSENNSLQYMLQCFHYCYCVIDSKLLVGQLCDKFKATCLPKGVDGANKQKRLTAIGARGIG